MKKTIALALFACCLVPLGAQNLTGIEKWLPGFPRGKTDFAGYKITRCVIERTGALVVLDRDGTSVRLNIIRPVELETAAARFAAVEKAVFSGLTSDKWTIAVEECEINFGLKDDLTVSLRLSSFRFRLNKETVLELSKKLEAEPEFYRRPQDDGFDFSLRFRGIGFMAAGREAFPGWPDYVKRLGAWFQGGLDANRQETIALVLETKAGGRDGKKASGPITIARDNQPGLRTGMNVAYLMPGFVNAEWTALSFNPGVSNMLLPAVYLSWRNIGDGNWLAKPYRVTVSVGAFGELNAGYFSDPPASPGSPLSFLIAFGPAVGCEFTAMIPRIIDNQYTGDLFGIGVELLTVFNVPYFFPDYEYDYFLTQFVNFIFHILPGDGAGADAVLGFNFTFGTLNYEDGGAIRLTKVGVTVGARCQLDFRNASGTAGPPH